ncbi:hypothetical protein KHM83_18325 [Fusibacter paucivorans]|uniref:histidine kinase n=1 Tax=Fusibacter paucivorans TaxID=76009 RepID=A0ABS5PTX8_9FIRM|nr:HAMP domain-containing sensor histidine kinase [Fusibacter paucivorans]MBS7528629.1 hypothetical protein [Fusibacter paucivorans]
MGIKLKTLRHSDKDRRGGTAENANWSVDQAETAAEIARQMNVKTGKLNTLIAILLTACIAFASVVLGVIQVVDDEMDFYQTWRFSNYYNNILQEVIYYADLLKHQEEGDNENDANIASWKSNLAAYGRFYYRITDLTTGEILTQSAQFDKQQQYAIVISTIEDAEIETLYRTSETQSVLTNVRLYENSVERLQNYSLKIEAGIVAYDDYMVGDELHDRFEYYYFFSQLTPYLTWMVIGGFITGILALWLFGIMIRRLLRAPNRYKIADLLPSDIALILLGCIVVLAGAIFFDALEPDLFWRGNDIERAGMVALLFVLLICASVISALAASLLCSLFEGTMIRKSLIYRFFKGIGNWVGGLSRALFSHGPIRRKLVGFVLLTGVVVACNVLLSMAWSPVLMVFIPVDLLIIWWVFRFVFSLSDIVESVYYAPQREYDMALDIDKMMPALVPFAERLNSMQESVNEAVAEAIKGERLKTELLTNVSHDLKTPLTAVINYVKLLMQHETEDDTVKEYVDVLDEKTQRLKVLVDDILEMSKLSSGNVHLSIETVDLEQVLTQALAEFEESFHSRALRLLRSENDMPVYIEADSDKLWRVLENLLGNIAKYALNGSRVYVVTLIQKNFVQLEIKNISAEPLSQDGAYFTERFARGDQARRSEGSGLGLAIAKELFERMGGHFEVHVDGDLFKVTLVFERSYDMKSSAQDQAMLKSNE